MSATSFASRTSVKRVLPWKANALTGSVPTRGRLSAGAVVGLVDGWKSERGGMTWAKAVGARAAKAMLSRIAARTIVRRRDLLARWPIGARRYSVGWGA